MVGGGATVVFGLCFGASVVAVGTEVDGAFWSGTDNGGGLYCGRKETRRPNSEMKRECSKSVLFGCAKSSAGSGAVAFCMKVR
ncbi:MAG TPA: hypothetical protein VL119_15585, partial [Acidimicrobiia bacterium]|nr:hypothetical protein [Acidimicrobiia bacterium]